MEKNDVRECIILYSLRAAFCEAYHWNRYIIFVSLLIMTIIIFRINEKSAVYIYIDENIDIITDSFIHCILLIKIVRRFKLCIKFKSLSC